MSYPLAWCGTKQKMFFRLTYVIILNVYNKYLSIKIIAKCVQNTSVGINSIWHQNKLHFILIIPLEITCRTCS